jgi:hypothetical protein
MSESNFRDQHLGRLRTWIRSGGRLQQFRDAIKEINFAAGAASDIVRSLVSEGVLDITGEDERLYLLRQLLVQIRCTSREAMRRH